MSLYWERVLSNSPTQQNVDHSGLSASTTAAAQQNNPSTNWDYINLGSGPPQQQHYHWGQHIGSHVEGNRSTGSPGYDPYGAAVMGGYQQAAQNVVYPYQQQQHHEASPNRYAHGAASQISINQPVDQNHYIQQQRHHQQQHQQQLSQQHQSQQQQQQQQQQILHQQQQSNPTAVSNPSPAVTQQAQHTLVPARQNTQSSSHQNRSVEPQSVVLPPQPPTSFTPPTSLTPPSSNAQSCSEQQSVPLAVISPAVALPNSTIPPSHSFPTVPPFNSRSSPQQHHQGFTGTIATSTIPQETCPRRSPGETSSRRSSLTYLAVQPLLSVQSPPATGVVTDIARVGDSAQVTPESTYSVDTFGSGISSTDHPTHQRGVSSSSGGAQQSAARTEDNWEDDWERTEHPDRGGVREITPSDAASQTQSEPPGYPSSFPDTPCATREGSVALATDNDTTPHRSEPGSDVVRVAPVSTASPPVVGVPRYGN
ncbi:hypothetical protein NECAME_14454 [Necator americanus]|uniref:Uncharacterized protein n=1 Tax=Necator americanus TaxID=51031 RepID=W2SMM0_NECAM|nr:hypothetical protein NECAME_14454 [Necator americanus]ETN70880.1 hypothetical protein NECAME_14454 [Necator americanus]